MHFTNTYDKTLLTLPLELREKAIQYNQLEGLIKSTVQELENMGLHPLAIRSLLERSTDDGALSQASNEISTVVVPPCFSNVVYEVLNSLHSIQPQLKFYAHCSRTTDWHPRKAGPSSCTGDANDMAEDPRRTIEWCMQAPSLCTSAKVQGSPEEIVIPLEYDAAFLQKFSVALRSLLDHLLVVKSNFINSVQDLARHISNSVRPQHISSPSSSLSTLSRIFMPDASSSDLYPWREIFQLYVDAEIFESIHESHRGPRPSVDAEARLQAFEGMVAGCLERKLKLEQSRQALRAFLALNFSILNVKKFEEANTEAAQKLLKRRTQTTGLPLRPFMPDTTLINAVPPESFELNGRPTFELNIRAFSSLSLALVQVIGEHLLPVIPHIDDYSCPICTSIAFKPIRLACGHLFCVRCLVKLQRKGREACPICRSPTVVIADHTNYDWAIHNFVHDWFPSETKAKQKSNELESAKEELSEMGFSKQMCILA